MEDEEPSITWVITRSIFQTCATCAALLFLSAVMLGGCDRLRKGIGCMSSLTGLLFLLFVLALSVFFIRRSKGDGFLRSIEERVEEFSIPGFLSFRKRNSELAKQDLERMLDAGLMQLIADDLKKQADSPPEDEQTRKQNEDKLNQRFLANWVRQDNLRNLALQQYLEQTGTSRVLMRFAHREGSASFDAVVRRNTRRHYVRVVVSESGDVPQNKVEEAIKDFKRVCKGSSMRHEMLDVVVAIPKAGDEQYRVLQQPRERLVFIHVCPIELKHADSQEMDRS